MQIQGKLPGGAGGSCERRKQVSCAKGETVVLGASKGKEEEEQPLRAM